MAFLIGQDALSLSVTLREENIPHEVVGTLDAAVPAAYATARRLEVPVVMLSPACASLDQFGSFEARGERFEQLVQALQTERLS
jgi:UDP-N-acetylmuramoylalanine--D-glutamate ligase